MFSSYELVDFSEKMRKIRDSLDYSRQDVSNLTGINTDTLRKIEKGISVPRFETLEILSHLYKIDLLLLLNNYKANTTTTYYYDSINFFLVRNDIKSFLELHTEFCNWNKLHNINALINRSELLQLELFFEALFLDLSEQDCSFKQVIENLVASLRVTIPSFTLENWKTFNYNVLELRILYCIASYLLNSKDYYISKNILTFLLDKVDITSQAKMNYHFMLIKLYTLISYNCHMLDEHFEALSAAENGIKLCQQHNIMENLPLLLSRKGVAMMSLKIDNYSVFLNQAVELLKIQNNYDLANQYKTINKKYGID